MYMLDELVQLYSYAEDLDTYEHAAKELSTFFAGPVSLTFLSPRHKRDSDRVGQTRTGLRGRSVRRCTSFNYPIPCSLMKHFGQHSLFVRNVRANS